MNNPFNFNQPADLAAMKKDIADRAYSVKLKGMLITGLFGAAALGLLFFAPAALGAATPLIGLLAGVGGAIAGLMTLKETKQLEIDQQFLESRMQGRNMWSGYREELGANGPQPGLPMMGMMPQERKR